MSGTAQRPPQGEPWIWLTLGVMKSEAWRALGINARRFLDFLMIEHMAHGGAQNGYLLAPRRQLEQAGIGAQYVSGAIEEAERLGFVDVKRGVGKRPSTYALKWLPLGTAPTTPRRSSGSVVTYEGKSLPMTYNRKHQVPTKVSHETRSDLQREVANPNPSTYKGKHLLRASYQGSGYSKDLEGGGPDVVGSEGAPGTDGDADGEAVA